MDTVNQVLYHQSENRFQKVLIAIEGLSKIALGAAEPEKVAVETLKKIRRQGMGER